MSDVVRRRRVLSGRLTTLADVASAANVSTASASRALTRPDMVSDELRLKVSRAATGLGYVPNVAARALAGRRSALIGVLLGDLEGPGVADALVSLDEQLARAGRALMLGHCATGEASAARTLALLRRGVDALVFLGVDTPSGLREMPGIENVPCVSVDRTDDTRFVASAGLDVARAHGLAVAYLAQLGHRHVAVADDGDQDRGTTVFLDSVLRTAGGSSVTLQRLNLADETIADAVRECRALPQPPTAVLCSNDRLALGIVQACTAHGINVPGDLSVTGFGDTSLGRAMTPALTSVRIPARRAGIAAADYVLARLAGHAPATAELPVKLVIRASTGPAR